MCKLGVLTGAGVSFGMTIGFLLPPMWPKTAAVLLVVTIVLFVASLRCKK